MKLAIHQPYLFPYVGYFQLIHAVDAFVFLDDVGFRKQGWINRNRILVNGSPWHFSVPLSRASSSRPINRTAIDRRLFPEWRRRLLRTLFETYAGSRTRRSVLALVEKTLDAQPSDVASLATSSVHACCEYLDLERPFLTSSTSFATSNQRGVARVLAICRAANATIYVNAPGGQDLYQACVFEQAGIALRFLRPELDPYPQSGDGFVPGLSIIDLLMRVDRDEARLAVRQGSTA